MADAVRDITQGSTNRNLEDGGYLEIGLGGVYVENPIREGDNGLGVGIFLGGHYQWRGLFADIYYESFANLQLGYNFYNQGNWSFDILGAILNEELEPDTSRVFKQVGTRELDYNLGLRASGYFDKYVFVAETYSDISDTHNGNTIATFLGRHWQVRNWNLHAALIFRHQDARVTNYYVGITPTQSSLAFPVYKTDDSNITVLELGLAVPLKKDWVFKTTARRFYYSDSINDSPLLDSSAQNTLSAQFIYVY